MHYKLIQTEIIDYEHSLETNISQYTDLISLNYLPNFFCVIKHYLDVMSRATISTFKDHNFGSFKMQITALSNGSRDIIMHHVLVEGL